MASPETPGGISAPLTVRTGRASMRTNRTRPLAAQPARHGKGSPVRADRHAAVAYTASAEVCQKLAGLCQMLAGISASFAPTGL